MLKKTCVISYSDIASDARVLRQIKYLSKDHIVQIIGHGKPHPDFPPGPTIQWFEVPAKKRTLLGKWESLVRVVRYFLGWMDRPKVLDIAIQCQSDLYLANNWDSLPIAAEAARKNGALLFLDIHESLSTSGGFIFDILNRLIVKRYAGNINQSTTVVKAIARDYQNVFGFEPSVIMNVPSLPPTDITIKKSNPNKIRLVHHGIASQSRQPDLMIRTLALCDQRYELHLFFMNNNSDYVRQLKELSDRIVPGRVTFHPPFPSLDIVSGISKFDIGFYPLPTTIYNHQIALPNKLFEFIAAGLAVCIGPSPSMADIVNQHRCGIVTRSFLPEDFAATLNQTTAFQWDQMRIASLEASKILNAEIEMGKFVHLVDDLFE